MPPPVAGGVLQEELVTSQPPTTSDVEGEAPSREMAEETKQAPDVVKGTEPVQASIPLVAQDPRAIRTPVLKDPTFGQTPSPARTMIAEQTLGPVIAKKPVGATTSSTRTSRSFFLFSFLHCLSSSQVEPVLSDHP